MRDLSYLGHGARNIGKLRQVDGLDGVEHDHGGFEGSDGGLDVPEIGVRQEMEVGGAQTETLSAEVHLLHGLFARNVEDGGATLGESLRSGQQKRGLSHSGVATHQHERPRHETTTEHGVELGETGSHANLTLSVGAYIDESDRLLVTR